MNYEEKCDPELIQVLQGIIFEIWKIKERIHNDIAAHRTPPTYLRNYLRNMYTKKAKLQRIAVLYKEYSSIQNMLILGEEYIRQMKRDLPPLTFQTSILCKKVGLIRSGFYSNME